jgi:hypothetical protein
MSLRPTWVHRHTFGIIIGLFLVVAFLLGWAFNSSQVQVPVTAPVVERPAVVRSEYGQKRVIEDMLFLKRKLQLTGKSNYSISYRGAEYRLVKHFLNQLAPDVCPAFSSIDIWSMRTREGFQATSLCGQKQTPVTLVVKWTPEIADISLAGDDGGISLDLTI